MHLRRKKNIRKVWFSAVGREASTKEIIQHSISADSRGRGLRFIRIYKSLSPEGALPSAHESAIGRLYNTAPYPRFVASSPFDSLLVGHRFHKPSWKRHTLQMAFRRHFLKRKSSSSSSPAGKMANSTKETSGIKSNQIVSFRLWQRLICRYPQGRDKSSQSPVLCQLAFIDVDFFVSLTFA